MTTRPQVHIEAQSQNSRRACEPCRKKKVKCPAERPECAFCKRLKQPCTYAKRVDRAAVEKSNNAAAQVEPRDRIHVLESHIEQIYALLNDNNSRPIAQTPSTNVTLDSSTLAQSQETPDQSEVPFHLHQQTIDEAIELYNAQGQCGPVPWTSSVSLNDKFRSAPPSLSLAFVALTSRLSTELLSDQARQLCVSKARHEVFNALSQGLTDLGIIQALCFLIQVQITESNSPAAWDDISTGIRRVFMGTRTLMSNHSEDWLQAFWCLWALERMYCSGLSVITILSPHTAYPRYPAITHIPAYIQADTRLLLEAKSEEAISVQTLCLRLLDVWAQAMEFVQGVKDGECDKSWSSTGSYQKVVSSIYDVEIQGGELYRLRNAKPANYSSTQLHSERQFWAPWFMTQILYHAIQALINHPLLHIVQTRGGRGKAPPSFLQHTVDQTLLHASWVAKFISLCDEKDFVLNEPFVAHLASVAATSLMFFLDASDGQLASQAAFGFNTCQSFVRTLSSKWPHLRHTLQKLDVLQTSRCKQPTADGQSHSRSVRAMLPWNLLHYSSSTTPALQDTLHGTIDLEAGTEFLSPLDSVDTRPADRRPFDVEHTSAQEQVPEFDDDGHILHASPQHDFDIYSADMFANFQASSFNPSFWSDFRL